MKSAEKTDLCDNLNCAAKDSNGNKSGRQLRKPITKIIIPGENPESNKKEESIYDDRNDYIPSPKPDQPRSPQIMRTTGRKKNAQTI